MRTRVPNVTGSPPVGLPIAGVIEGFYGRPWTWAERAAVAVELAGWGMTDYVYAPKDDPKHRAELAGALRRRRARRLRRLRRGRRAPARLRDLARPVDRSGLRRRPGRPGAPRSTRCSTPASRSSCSASTTSPSAAGPQGGAHGRLTAWLARPPRRSRRSGARPDRVRRHPLDAVPRRARRQACPPTCRSAGPATPSSTTPSPRRRPRRRAEALGGRAAAAVGQRPGQRRPHGRPAPPRPALGARPRPGRPAELSPATSPTRWCSRTRRCCRWRRSPRGCAARTRSTPGSPRPIGGAGGSSPRRATAPCPHALVAVAADAFAARPARPRRARPAAAVVRRRRHGRRRPASRRSARRGSSRSAPRPAVALGALALLERRRRRPAAAPATSTTSPRVFVLGFRWKALQGATVSVMGPRLGFRPVLGQAADGTLGRAPVVADRGRQRRRRPLPARLRRPRLGRRSDLSERDQLLRQSSGGAGRSSRMWARRSSSALADSGLRSRSPTRNGTSEK